VRVDTGVQDGGEIPMYYDSMIAKLIVHGKDRNDAIAKMREALNGFVIRGVSSNIPFQSALLAHPKFVSGDFNTGFIAEHYASGLSGLKTCRMTTRTSWSRWRPTSTAARCSARAGISGQLRGHEFKVGEQYVVVRLGVAGEQTRQPASVTDFQAQSGSSAVETATASAMKSVAETGTWVAHAYAARSTARPLPRRWSAARHATSWPCA
jgi:propionyl-CoA carboxylase alpha chain